jgi:C1A family cysteine protease
MKPLVILMFIAAVITCGYANKEMDEMWKSYKEVNKLSLDSDEEKSGRESFEKCVNYVQKHNARYDLGFEQYNMSINNFCWYSRSKFVATKTGYQPPLNYKRSAGTVKSGYFNYNSLPASVDWRKNGTVSSVRNQGECGCCWAFATASALEHCYKMRTGKLMEISKQHLIDCASTPEYGNYGCNGGRMSNALNFTAINGVVVEKDYPYEGNDINECRAGNKKQIKLNDGFEMVAKNELELKRIVATIGPVTVGINTTPPQMQYYSSGVFFHFACNPNTIDHAVVIVGYGSMKIRNKNVFYWIIKNTWGDKWGEKGYIKMKRGLNACGVTNYAIYPKCLPKKDDADIDNSDVEST